MIVSMLAGPGHRLRHLLRAAGLAKSTYYHLLSHPAAVTRPDIEPMVAEIFARTPNGCGHRQIRMCLVHEFGVRVSHKSVLKVMRRMGLECRIRRPNPYRKYSSYRDETGARVENLLNRDFTAERPWVKLGTDVTEFRVADGKAYPAPATWDPRRSWPGTSAGIPTWPSSGACSPCSRRSCPKTPTRSCTPIKPGLLLSRGTVRGLGGWPCPMWFPGLTFRVMFVLSHLIRTKEFAMGETTVGHVAGEVVRALYGAGYMESTIGQYRKSIRALERYAGGPDAVYTRGLGAGFAASTFSERTGGFSRQRWFDYGRLARLCDSYLRSGSVDLGKWRRSRLAEPVVPGLAVVMERWEAYLAGSGLASATVGHYRRMAGLFLTWLESHGVVSLDGSDGSHVLGFLAGLRSRWSESSMRHAASDLRPLFRWLGRDDLADAIGLAGIRRTHAIAGTLPDDEHRRLLEACASRSVPSRDAAITLLSLTCGLRACDVIGLRIADVDWDSMSIGLVQRKTGNPLTVPMTGPLAARLASWLLDERPATDDDRVFVRYKAPHVALRVCFSKLASAL